MAHYRRMPLFQPYLQPDLLSRSHNSKMALELSCLLELCGGCNQSYEHFVKLFSENTDYLIGLWLALSLTDASAGWDAVHHPPFSHTWQLPRLEIHFQNTKPSIPSPRPGDSHPVLPGREGSGDWMPEGSQKNCQRPKNCTPGHLAGNRYFAATSRAGPFRSYQPWAGCNKEQ